MKGFWRRPFAYWLYEKHVKYIDKKPLDAFETQVIPK